MSGSSTSDPLIGRELDGYFIEELLGQGGMARVYRGRDVRLSRHVAVKVIQPDARTDPDYARRFEKEARAVALLEHPHIVRIYRFGEVAGLYYMVMPYIEGADLSWVLGDYTADKELLPHEDVLRIVSQIGSALDYAHSRGVIHRDVKPSNIMLTKRGDAVLTDFGLVLLQIEGTLGEVFGTPYYMAPEQAINSAGAVPQSDIYALGVVLYEMLTGRVPFDEGSGLDIAMAHVTEAPPHPLLVNPDLHPAFVKVLDTALEKEPTDRFQTGTELSDALREAMAIAAGASQQMQVPTTRLSSLHVPDKVSKFRQNNPLPPLPTVIRQPEPQQATRRAAPATPTQKPASRDAKASRRPLWYAGLALVAIALALIAALLLAGHSPNAGVQRSANTDPATIDGPSLAESLASVDVTDQVVPEIAITPSALPATPGITATQTALEFTPATIATATTEAVAAPPTISSEQPTAQPVIYTLRIVTRGEDSLFLINDTADLSFPLASLRLGEERGGGIVANEWGLDVLAPGACVTAWKDRGNPRAPDVECEQVGQRIARRGPQRFWKDRFGVYYQGVLITSCDRSCTFQIAEQHPAGP